jgi:hypothetical protein
MTQKTKIPVSVVLLGIVCSAVFLSLAFIAWTDGQITVKGRHGTRISNQKKAVMLGFLYCAIALGIWAPITHAHRYATQIKLGLLIVWLGIVAVYWAVV